MSLILSAAGSTRHTVETPAPRGLRQWEGAVSVLHCWAIDGGEHGYASSSSARTDELSNSQRLNAQVRGALFVAKYSCA